MQFSPILTSFALLGALTLSSVPAALAQGGAQARSSADEVILEMQRAYKRLDRKRLSALLPQAKGHALEPWGAYWELAARLDEAPTSEIQDFLTRYAGTYQEDRLRNDWLLLLGKRRDWATFSVEYPKYRMNDDRSVRCYALFNAFASNGTDVAEQVQEAWLAQKEADDGCAAAAEQQLKADKLKPHSAWLRARLGLENDRPRIATQAVALLGKDRAETLNTVYSAPAKYLNAKFTALRPPTKELVTLALVRLAVVDPAAAAKELSKLRWKTQLTSEERAWVWGVIGKRAAQRLSGDALGYFEHAENKYLHDDHLAGRRAPPCAPASGSWCRRRSRR